MMLLEEPARQDGLALSGCQEGVTATPSAECEEGVAAAGRKNGLQEDVATTGERGTCLAGVLLSLNLESALIGACDDSDSGKEIFGSEFLSLAKVFRPRQWWQKTMN
jgi:hypothetical protein